MVAARGPGFLANSVVRTLMTDMPGKSPCPAGGAAIGLTRPRRGRHRGRVQPAPHTPHRRFLRPAGVLAALVALLGGITAVGPVGAAEPARSAPFPVVERQLLPERALSVVVGASGTAYATLSESRTLAIAAPGEPLRTIALPGTSGLMGVAVTSDESTAYVLRRPEGSTPDGGIDRVDLTTGTVTPIPGVTDRPSSLVLTEDDALLVTGSVEYQQLTLIDTATATVGASIDLVMQPSAIDVKGRIAYVAGFEIVRSVDLTRRTVLRTVEFPGQGEVRAIDVRGVRVCVGMARGGTDAARLAILDSSTLSILDTVDIPIDDPGSNSPLYLAAGFSQVYATWGNGWRIDGVDTAAAVVPVTAEGFGVPQPLIPSLDNTDQIALNANGSRLAMTGNDLGTDPILVLDTEDADRFAYVLSTSLDGRTLRVTGETLGVPRGTQVVVFVKQGKKYVAQKKKVRIRADGSFGWSVPSRATTVRFYVLIGSERTYVLTARTPRVSPV